ncbi:hypothetical protein AgCh_005717 [Apium graveolens]
MATSQNIIQAMNNISFEEEEEGGIAFEEVEGEEVNDILQGLNIHLCLVGRFINEGVVDFTTMKHTLASIWKPGKGVSVKEIDVNLYIFQFYHELDIKRVIRGSPWTFNRKALLIARMKEGDVSRGVNLNKLDLWIQIYDMQVGLMTERVLREVVGHSENFCNSLFNTHEEEIVRPYGAWLRAPFRKQNKLVGSRWLREGDKEDDGDRNTASAKSGETNHTVKQIPLVVQIRDERDNQGDTIIIVKDIGANSSVSNLGELYMDSDCESMDGMGQNDSKNALVAGSGTGVRQGL